VQLSQASASVVTALVHTRAGTATGGNDYIGNTETLRFAPGETSAVLSIDLINDSVFEPSESFIVRIAEASGAQIAQQAATVTIADDDTDTGLPAISVTGGSVNEGAGNATARVSLSEAAASAVTFTIFTQAGTATPSSDYYGNTESMTIPAGSTTGSFSFAVLDDSQTETTENITVRITGVDGAAVVKDRDTINIVDND